ncbi:hypothetical protein DFH07DRAFT_922611, partial [Mycena maculata]
MAGFLRKKKPESVVRTPSPPVNNAPPPLFARFAASSVDPPAQRVVSSPMALASAPRRDQAPRMNNGAGVRGGGQQQQQDEAKRTRYNVQSSYVQQNQAGPSNPSPPSASNGNSNSYGSPAQKRRSTPPTRTQTLPATDTTSPPPNRRFSHVPGTDKPLPTIRPQDNYPDPLGSTPPQSSIPANRRTSTRGLPPQTSAATQNLHNGRVMNAPAQQPHISPLNPSLSNASPSSGARPSPPSSGQTPSTKPNTIYGSSQSPSRYPKEHPQQDLRHKLSDVGSASGGPPAIPVPTSPPRQSTPGKRVPDGRAPNAPSSYQDPDGSFTLSNSKSTAVSPTDVISYNSWVLTGVP